MESFFPIDCNVSHIKTWLLDSTTLFNFFSSLSIIDNAGRAVQDIKSASAFSSGLKEIIKKEKHEILENIEIKTVDNIWDILEFCLVENNIKFNRYC